MRGGVEREGEAVAGEFEISVDVFAYVGGKKGAFKMMGNKAFLLVECEGAEIGVVAEDGLCRVWCALGGRGNLAFLREHFHGAPFPRKLCGHVARGVIDEKAHGSSGQAGIDEKFSVCAVSFETSRQLPMSCARMEFSRAGVAAFALAALA